MIGCKTIWDIYIKKSSEKTQISKISHIWKVHRIFILHQILTVFFFPASFVLKHFSSMLGRFSPSFTVSWQTCDQIYLLSNFNAGYMSPYRNWAIFFMEKGQILNGAKINFEIQHIWKTYTIYIFYLILVLWSYHIPLFILISDWLSSI